MEEKYQEIYQQKVCEKCGKHDASICFICYLDRLEMLINEMAKT